MATTRQIITNQFKSLVKERFATSKVEKAVNAMANEAINVIIERTNQGIDVNGKKFAKLTNKYQKYKKKYISSGAKVSKFGATKIPNHIRLSGALLASLTYDVIQYAQFTMPKISTAFRLRVKPNQEKKIEWLASETGAVRTRKGKKTYKKASRQFFGLSTAPNRIAKEQDRVIGAFVTSMQNQAGGSRKDMIIKNK